MPNFDRISGIYDTLKQIVFGNQLDKATSHFLKQIASNSKILIIGGGSGKILQNFNASHQIKYLELSVEMMEKAKKINSDAKVEFILADILDWTSNDKFDFIITPFILDCFDENKLDILFPNLKNVLNNKGEWIQTDFYPKNKAQKFLIKIMYFFFNLTAQLETKELADFDSVFNKYKFICSKKAAFYHSMIESKIYHQID